MAHNNYLFLKHSLCLGALFCLPSCAPTPVASPSQPPSTAASQVVQIAPLAPLERAQIRSALREGRPLPVEFEGTLENEADARFQYRMQGPGKKTSSPRPSPQQDECAAFRSSLEAGVIQGSVSVPEDWDQPGGRQIQVFYYARYFADDLGNPLHPVVFFNGGPSSDSHSSFDLLERRSAAQSLSMIYIDQRGTGCSSPYPTGAFDAATARRLALYGSRSIVRDAEAVRAKLLGAQGRWGVFGQSYGGQIVHRYVELAPEFVQAAFSHGAIAVTEPLAWIVGRLKSQLRVGRTYLQAYPDDLERLRSIRAAISPSQCFDDGVSRICGPSVMDAGTALLGFKAQWDSLHQWLGRIRGDSGKIDLATLSKFVRTFVFGAYVPAGMAGSVLSYQELTPGFTDARICVQAQTELRNDTEAEAPSSWPINECRMLEALRTPWEEALPSLGSGDPFSLDALERSLKEHPALRFFLYSGSLDVFSPFSIFEGEVRRLGERIRYRNFPNSGHEGYFTEPEVWDDLLSATKSI